MATGVTTSGTTTLVDPISPPDKLHEVPLPPNPLPKLPGLPEVSEFRMKWQKQKQSEPPKANLTLMPYYQNLCEKLTPQHFSATTTQKIKKLAMLLESLTQILLKQNKVRCILT